MTMPRFLPLMADSRRRRPGCSLAGNPDQTARNPARAPSARPNRRRWQSAAVM